MTCGGDSSAEAVGMPGGAAVEDVPVCLVLGTASVTAIEKKKKKITSPVDVMNRGCASP